MVHWLHGGVTTGHLGEDKTLGRPKARFSWPGSHKAVKLFCQGCRECVRRKSPPQKRKALIQTLTAGSPMQIVAVDILGPLPKSSKGNQYILVAADYFTKWMEAYPIPNQKASTVAQTLVDQFLLRYSPQSSYTPTKASSLKAGWFRIFENCSVFKRPGQHPTTHRVMAWWKDYIVPCCPCYPPPSMVKSMSGRIISDPPVWRTTPVCKQAQGLPHFSSSLDERHDFHWISWWETPAKQRHQTHPDYVTALQDKLCTVYTTLCTKLKAAFDRQKHHYNRNIHGKPYKHGDLVFLFPLSY